jgi:hypothetical protein
MLVGRRGPSAEQIALLRTLVGKVPTSELCVRVKCCRATVIKWARMLGMAREASISGKMGKRQPRIAKAHHPVRKASDELLLRLRSGLR